MAFVTRLQLSSGDRATLDRVVDEIRSSAQRKGVELKGPHSHPPRKLSVPQYRRVPPVASGTDGGVPGEGPEASGEFDRWRYTVYRREIEIVGHEEFARAVSKRGFPRAVHVEVEVDHRAGMGA